MKMDQKGIAPLIIVAIVAVVAVAAGVGIYAATRGGGNGGNGGDEVADASSLRFKVDTTVENMAGTYTLSEKNIGSSNMMMRIEGTFAGQDFVYIINGAQQKLWVETGGQWMDLSTNYSQYWSTWNQSFTGYKNQHAGWTGGDWTYTQSGVTVRIYNIEVNPSLSDSLFEHS
jgi:hypothetical protein